MATAALVSAAWQDYYWSGWKVSQQLPPYMVNSSTSRLIIHPREHIRSGANPNPLSRWQRPQGLPLLSQLPAICRIHPTYGKNFFVIFEKLADLPTEAFPTPVSDRKREIFPARLSNARRINQICPLRLSSATRFWGPLPISGLDVKLRSAIRRQLSRLDGRRPGVLPVGWAQSVSLSLPVHSVKAPGIVHSAVPQPKACHDGSQRVPSPQSASTQYVLWT